MFKRVLSLILCLCFILTACSNNKTTDKVINNTADDQFELIALKTDKQGIDGSSGFQLTSREKINKNYVRDKLQFIPQQEFNVEEVSSTVFNIIPLNQLENDKIYQVKLNDDVYDYSWAFQTKKKFEVESVLPADGSYYVPVNSGIEMNFSLGDYEKIDEFFEIIPKADGKFIEKDNMIIFVPEELKENTRYTVTIKKGFGLKDGSELMEDDYVFSFKTASEQVPQIYFSDMLTNIYEKNTKIVGAYFNNKYNNKEFKINIYKYKTIDKFTEYIKEFASTQNISIDNESDLIKINTISIKPLINDDKALFQLPEDLEKGYYLLEFNAEGFQEKLYHFMQINDMLVYNVFCDNQIIVLAADGKTSQGIKNAEVIINGESLGLTNENGMLIIEKDTSVYYSKTICMKVKASGYNDFVYANSKFYDHYFYRNLNESYKYLRYIDTDRPVYMPTDKINVWGFARYKNSDAVNKVKVELEETSTGLVQGSKYADLTEIGTYQTEFALNNYTAGLYRVRVYDNDVLISSKYITIQEYTKPLFTLNGEFDKEFVYSGENINYKINAKFFDGYPVPNLDINFNTYSGSYYGFTEYNTVSSNITLNQSGESEINIDTYVRSNNWRPVTIDVSSHNNAAEDKTVNVYNSFKVFPKHKMLELEQNETNPQSINILFHELKTTEYSKNNYDFQILRGKPLDDTVNVKIVEKYYEKTKTGEQYDYINKVNQQLYSYNLIENNIYDENIAVSGGLANIQIPDFKEDRNYEITAYYEDGNGGIEEKIYAGGRYYPIQHLYYDLKKSVNKENYRLNENITLNLIYDNQKVENTENSNLLVMFMRNGLIDYKISDKGQVQTSFKEEYLPNVHLNSIYIKNGYIYPVLNYDTFLYDRTEKQIYFDVTTDKEEYLPGEEVTLNITARDENNNPCKADINISVVDEAYFALFGKYVNTLDDLYSYIWDNGIRNSYLSNVDFNAPNGGGAERGGGGGNDAVFRDEFKDTNIFKTITTDKNGKSSMKFKLADNLTSWRITYQAISDKQFAGSGTKNITVSLPFYVDLIMGKEYLKEDKINATLRVFGTKAKESEQVNYKVTIKNKETGKSTEYTQKGIVGDYTNILLNNPGEGQYEIYVNASSNGLSDGIKEEFHIVDSSVYFNNTNYYKLTESTVLDKVYSNPVITLFNESNSDFYNSLSSIASSYGKRIDQTVCSMISSKYINDYFSTDLYFNEEELLQEINKYESEQGGIKLLPYSEASAELAAKLVHTVENDYLNTKLKQYFKNVLKEPEYNKNIAPALWGLSKYREPVLLTIYDLLEKDDLTDRDKLYLCLTLAELGDNKTAKKHYKEFVDNLKESGDYLYLDNTNDIDKYELTSLLSILGAKLKDYNISDKLFKYIYHNPSKYTLSNFEQLIYIMNRDIMKLNEIKDLFGEVTVTIDGKSQNYKLKLFDRESFAVPKEKIKDVKFSSIKGSIACKVDALGNKDDLERNKSADLSLKISYTPIGSSKEQILYKQSDEVKVTIIPSFANIESGNFEITYVIPAGFRFLNADRNNRAWFEENGQKLKFNFSYDKKTAITPIVFYIQAAQPGEYTVDYVVIKENMENKLNYLEKSALTVK